MTSSRRFAWPRACQDFSGVRSRLPARGSSWVGVSRAARSTSSPSCGGESTSTPRVPIDPCCGGRGVSTETSSVSCGKTVSKHALRTLLRQGVYLTVEEFKRRRAVVRGSLTFAVEPEALRNPGVRVVLSSRSSGGGGTGTSVPMDLAHLKDRAINTLLAMDARGGAAWAKAQWLVPGGGALAQLLEFSRFGPPVRRWFTQVDPARLPPRYRWSARVVRGSSLVAGSPAAPAGACDASRIRRRSFTGYGRFCVRAPSPICSPSRALRCGSATWRASAGAT